MEPALRGIAQGRKIVVLLVVLGGMAAHPAQGATALSSAECMELIGRFPDSPSLSGAVTGEHVDAVARSGASKDLVRLAEAAREGAPGVLDVRLIEGREAVRDFLRQWDAARHPGERAERDRREEALRAEAERARDERTDELHGEAVPWMALSAATAALGAALLGAKYEGVTLAGAGATVLSSTASYFLAKWRAAREVARRYGLQPDEGALGSDVVGRLYTGLREGPVEPFHFAWTGKPQRALTSAAGLPSRVSVGFAISEGPNGPFLLLVVADPKRLPPADGRLAASSVPTLPLGAASVATPSARVRNRHGPSRSGPEESPAPVTSEDRPPLIRAEIREWLRDEVRDPQAIRKIESVFTAFERHGLDGISDKKLLNRFGVWEIRIHIGPGYRLYARRDRHGRWVLATGDRKPREGSAENYDAAQRAADLIDAIED